MNTAAISQYIDFSDFYLQATVACMILAPTIWNILARLEYFTHILTKIACNNRYLGCYLLTAWIFSFSIFRDYMFTRALENQPTWALLDNSYVTLFGYLLMGVGGVFVLSSMYALGVTGTYLGDYFGILMDSRVESFPFNVLDDPMYDGASMVFLGQALVAKSPAGLFLTFVVYVCYRIALLFEGPFTARIYREKAEREAKKAAKKN